jgi:hypothetical protein
MHRQACRRLQQLHQQQQHGTQGLPQQKQQRQGPSLRLAPAAAAAMLQQQLLLAVANPHQQPTDQPQHRRYQVCQQVPVATTAAAVASM